MAEKVHSLIVLTLFGCILSVHTQSPQLSPFNTSLLDKRPTRFQYTVSTVTYAPWVIRTADGYSGLVIDILDHVARLSGFDYQLQEPADGKYGSLDYETGQYTGIIGDVVTKRADIGAANLAVTESRSDVVRFSSPFAETGAQMLLQRPVTKRDSLTFLFLPFTYDTWCLLVVCCVVMVIGWYVVNTFCSSEKSLEDGCCNSQCMSNHCQLTYPDRTKSTRASTVWSVTCWCFLVGFVVLYASNLTGAILYHGSIHMTLPFKYFHEMANQADIAYGGWFGMELNLNSDLQRRIDKFINSKYTFYNTMDEAITKIRSSNGKYVAIVDGYSAKNILNKNCDLILLNDRLFEIYYSFACQNTPQGADLCVSITASLEQLRQNGTLFTLFNYWWEQHTDTQCTPPSEEDYESRHGRMGLRFEPMSITETAMVFVTILVGAVLTVIVFAIDKFKKTSSNKKRPGPVELEEDKSLTKVT